MLVSTGHCFEEVAVVRFASQGGQKKCPVSGAPLKFLRWQLARTPNYALRNLIASQAKVAQVRCPR